MPFLGVDTNSYTSDWSEDFWPLYKPGWLELTISSKMRLSPAFFASTLASHYRGGTYKVSPVDETTLKIVNTQTWRLRADHYSGGCQQSDVTNQVQVIESAFCPWLKFSPTGTILPPVWRVLAPAVKTWVCFTLHFSLELITATAMVKI